MADRGNTQLGLDLGPTHGAGSGQGRAERPRSSTLASTEVPDAASPESLRVIRVTPDVVGVTKRFDYSVPKGLEVQIGDIVRVRLGSRTVRGWVTATDVEPEPGIDLQPIVKVIGRGPTEDLIELAEWAAWRWAGRAVHLLRTVGPPTAVNQLPRPSSAAPTPATDSAIGTSEPSASEDATLREALAAPLGLLELGPAEDRYRIAAAAVGNPGDGRALILVPTTAEATALAARLHRNGLPVALIAGQEPASVLSRQWAMARAGWSVVGTRAAAWTPVDRLGRVVVFDEHDEAYQGGRTPTWNARDVAVERARRAGAPCLLVSPTPSLVAVATATPLERQGRRLRGGWPPVEVIDQRQLDPSQGLLFSPRAVNLARDGGRVLFILDRTGRVRLLSCSRCRTTAACETCGGPVSLESDGGRDELTCSRDDHRRPPVCLECGATAFKHLRLGVGRAREELEALALRPVGEVTGASTEIPRADVLIGTEALLHRVTGADAVVFLDADQHLLSGRMRATEQALAMFGRAARIAARRDGRVVVQTRDPEHPVVTAVSTGDQRALRTGELEVRRALGLPPYEALALVSGEAAGPLLDELRGRSELSIQGPVDGVWRIRASDHRQLCDAFAEVERPEGRVRIEVDPLSI